MDTGPQNCHIYPWPYYYGNQPQVPSLYGYGTTYLSGPPITEDRIREIIREELREALKAVLPKL